MKNVRVIKFDDNHDMVFTTNLDYIRAASMENIPNMVCGAGELIVDATFETEDISIRKIVDHGYTHYIAVQHKVWEYLYLVENPVTAISQDEKIEDLKGKNKRLNTKNHQLTNQVEVVNNMIDKMLGASPLERVRWVFKGVRA